MKMVYDQKKIQERIDRALDMIQRLDRISVASMQIQAQTGVKFPSLAGGRDFYIDLLFDYMMDQIEYERRTKKEEFEPDDCIVVDLEGF